MDKEITTGLNETKAVLAALKNIGTVVNIREIAMADDESVQTTDKLMAISRTSGGSRWGEIGNVIHHQSSRQSVIFAGRFHQHVEELSNKGSGQAQ